MSCSLMFSGMSSRAGTCRNLPLLRLSSHSIQGYLLWLKPARLSAITSNDLACCRTSAGDTQTVYHVVQTGLKELKQDFTGNTFHRGGLGEEVAELFLKYAVGVFSFLLFTQLDAVLAGFAATVLSVLARGEVASCLDFVGAEDGFAEFTGDFGLRTCVSCHCCIVLYGWIFDGGVWRGALMHFRQCSAWRSSAVQPQSQRGDVRCDPSLAAVSVRTCSVGTCCRHL